MAKIQKIAYDKKSKVFSIKISNKKSVDSDIQRNVVIDYDKDGKVVRVNIYDIDFESFRNGRRGLKEFARGAGMAVLTK